MKKLEVIKLMKEGTHFLVYDTTDRDSLIIEILSELGMNFSKSIPDYGLNGSINPINLSEIEPDNEKPYKMKTESEIISKHLTSIVDQDGDRLKVIFVSELDSLIKELSEIQPDPNHDKPYLFYEGEKYYFGEEYEFSDELKKNWHKTSLSTYRHTNDYRFLSTPGGFKHIRKIDHTTKYKKLLVELKEQAEKDGVNLKDLL